MHAIDVSTGQAACAYRGETPWHGLGTALDDNATVEQWVVAAGLNWNAVKAPVRYAMPDGTTRDYYGRSVIYRDDTEAALGVVSDSYQIVQPREVVEFFKDAVGQADMKLEVAGAHPQAAWPTTGNTAAAGAAPGAAGSPAGIAARGGPRAGRE